jgi:hypothetical protein
MTPKARSVGRREREDRARDAAFEAGLNALAMQPAFRHALRTACEGVVVPVEWRADVETWAGVDADGKRASDAVSCVLRRLRLPSELHA